MKIDLKKQIATYSAPRGSFELVTPAPARFLMVDGAGDPNTSKAYADAVGSLYPVAYAAKFLSKGELGRDYVVMPLEALWWSEDMRVFTEARDKSAWRWTVMILVPDWVDAALVEGAIASVRRKATAPALDLVRLEDFDEGLSAQTLHVGPYDDEGPVLERMHDEFIPAAGLVLTGRHHEIYLSDPRRSSPDKLKTILRQPVERRA